MLTRGKLEKERSFFLDRLRMNKNWNFTYWLKRIEKILINESFERKHVFPHIRSHSSTLDKSKISLILSENIETHVFVCSCANAFKLMHFSLSIFYIEVYSSFLCAKLCLSSHLNMSLKKRFYFVHIRPWMLCTAIYSLVVNYTKIGNVESLLVEKQFTILITEFIFDEKIIWAKFLTLVIKTKRKFDIKCSTLSFFTTFIQQL